MQLPLQITFDKVSSSEAIEAKIRQKTDKLNKLYNRLIGCRDELKVGSAVSFVEEAGEKGPQASTVRFLEKNSLQG